MRHIIIQEYLSSLKEDNELDFLFPLLLDNMGFKVISTPKNSKGQSQYGKDIVAIGIDENGKKWKWYLGVLVAVLSAALFASVPVSAERESRHQRFLCTQDPRCGDGGEKRRRVQEELHGPV